MEVQLDMKMVQAKVLGGIEQIKPILAIQEAVLMIGDTGVGKSTIMSYLAQEDLKVEMRGLKNCLVGC